MATTTPMLPGLGGAPVGAAPNLNATTVPLSAQNAVAANASGSISTTPTMTSAGIAGTPGAPVPAGTLPTPQTNNNLSPTGHTTALPGQNAPAGTPLSPTVTQMLNTPALLNTTNPDLSAFGVNGTKNANQGTDLAAQYAAAHESLKGTTAPATNQMRTDSVQQTMDKAATDTATQTDTQKEAMDAYASMNPVVKSLYDQIETSLSATGTAQTFADQYAKSYSDPNLPAGTPGVSFSQEQLQLMDVNRIMSGTEDDIRNEITKAGGFATESQVAALTTARNKTLLTQATSIKADLALKQDYIDHISTLTQADRAEVDKQVTQQTGLLDKVQSIQDNMDKAATDMYQKTLTNLGSDYTAFASTVPKGQQSQAERLLGLSPGTLSNKDELAYLTASSLKQQQLAQAGQRVQISLNNAGSLTDYRALLGDLAVARTNAANANTVNATIKSLYGTQAANPITAYRTASIWIGNVNAAYGKSTDPTNSNKGASDLELIDAAVKLNNGGQQVTQVQVDALSKSLSLKGKITVEGGKVAGYSGILDTGTRTAIRDLATSNLIQKRIAATDATATINTRLSQTGSASNMSLPEITAAIVPQDTINTGTLGDGTVVYQTKSGQVVDAEGNQYDAEGNRI